MPGGRCRLQRRQQFFNSFNHGQSRRIRLLQKIQIRRAMTVDANNIGLIGESIGRFRHVADRDGLIADHPNGNLIELGQRLFSGLEFNVHVVFETADASRSRRQNQIGRSEGH